MSIVDIFLLAPMSSPNRCSLAKTVQKIRLADMNKGLYRIGSYPELNVLKNHDLVNVSEKKRNFLRNLTERYISDNRV
jgi:hypothetical protein